MESTLASPRVELIGESSFSFLSPLLVDLCDGLARHIHRQHKQSIAKVFCVACNEYHPRSAEIGYAFAVAYRETKDVRFLEQAKLLTNWLLQLQREGGFWVEGKAGARDWRGCTIHTLLSLSATYLLLEDELSRPEQETWKAAIVNAARWVERYEPVSHLAQTWTALRHCRVNASDSMRRQLRRTLNTNYLAEIPAGLQLSTLVTGVPVQQGRLEYFLSHVERRFNEDELLRGEDADEAKFLKPFRRSDGIDVVYNLLSLGVLALFAKLADEDELLSRIRRSADAHLNFMYPNGAIDNGQGTRARNCVPSQINMHLLCAMLFEADAMFRRASRLNAETLHQCMMEGTLAAGPYLNPHERTKQCNYRTMWRAADIAFAMQFATNRAPRDNGRLFFEHENNLATIKSLNSVILKSGGSMMTVSGNRYRSTCLPYRSPLLPTGGSITMLYFEPYGPVQVSTFIGQGSITPRIESASADYCSAHDTTAEIAAADNVVTIRGHLSKRWLGRKSSPYKIMLRLEDCAITKRIRVKNVGRTKPINIVEPLVMHRDVQSYDATDDGFLIRTDRHELSISFMGLDCTLSPWCTDPRIVKERGLRAWPVGVKVVGSGEVTLEVRIALRLIGSE